ncbi:MupA/Atu3671 family FMN-dependent luciferase-like monooxygenase [Kitasatospora sp. NPDC001574]
MDLGLFYFADDAAAPDTAAPNAAAQGGRAPHGDAPDAAAPRGGVTDRYRLLLEGARFADRAGFAAVWTPERHFHRFGGLYPNPAVTGAAIAACTERIAIRAGSVVAPLHHVLRIAEEWAVVDGLSGGRAGLSLASGWNPADFVLRPEGFEGRDRAAVEAVDTLRRLWRGEPLPAATADGPEGPRIFPLPVNGPLPMWLTSAGNPGTFRAAGRAGVGVLTHLANQDLAELALRTAEYRHEHAAAGHPGRGRVVLMVHTLLGEDQAEVEARARGPLEDYLVSAMTLFGPKESAGWSPARTRAVVRPALRRYLHQGCGLFGTVARAEELVEEYRRAGVDELACLVDFGVPAAEALDGLEHLAELGRRVARPAPGRGATVPDAGPRPAPGAVTAHSSSPPPEKAVQSP